MNAKATKPPRRSREEQAARADESLRSGTPGPLDPVSTRSAKEPEAIAELMAQKLRDAGDRYPIGSLVDVNVGAPDRPQVDTRCVMTRPSIQLGGGIVIGCSKPVDDVDPVFYSLDRCRPSRLDRRAMVSLRRLDLLAVLRGDVTLDLASLPAESQVEALNWSPNCDSLAITISAPSLEPVLDGCKVRELGPFPLVPRDRSLVRIRNTAELVIETVSKIRDELNHNHGGAFLAVRHLLAAIDGGSLRTNPEGFAPSILRLAGGGKGGERGA